MGVARIGIGGWDFAPWRGTFYPDDLPQAQELSFATRALATLEINGTFYSTFERATWEKWGRSAPEGFVYAVKASRYCTNRKRLSEAGSSIDRFLSQGLTALGPKLGPINWQFSPRKRFEAEDFEAFLNLLPKTRDGMDLRHAVEVRHPSFAVKEFVGLAARHGVAVVYAEGKGVPTIDAAAGGYRYARLMTTRDRFTAGLPSADIARYADLATRWAKTGDAFIYMISGAKQRNPAAALAIAEEIERARQPVRRRGRGVSL